MSVGLADLLQKVHELAREASPLGDGLREWLRDQRDQADVEQELKKARERIALMQEAHAFLAGIKDFVEWLNWKAKETGLPLQRMPRLLDAERLVGLLEKDLRSRLCEERRWRKWLLTKSRADGGIDDE